MEQFTASEMRAEAHRHANEVEDMLNAAADLLEAREKAVPVAITCDGYDGDRTGCIKSDKPLPLGTNLYTHPATSDAGRLTEALRGILEIGKRNMENQKYDGFFNAAREALAAHSAHTPWTEGEKAHFKAAAELVAQREAAQAQPPAASVPTLRYFIGGPKACAYVDKPEHVEAIITALCECTGDDSEDYTATDLSAAHSAKAQPPDAVDPMVGYRHDEPERYGYAQGWNACRAAMLAAQENPNG